MQNFEDQKKKKKTDNASTEYMGDERKSCFLCLKKNNIRLRFLLLTLMLHADIASSVCWEISCHSNRGLGRWVIIQNCMAESGKELRQTSLSTTQKQCMRNERNPCETEHFTYKNTWTQLTGGISYEWHGKKKSVILFWIKKKNTSVTKPQRCHFKQKKYYIEATQVTLKFISWNKHSN